MEDYFSKTNPKEADLKKYNELLAELDAVMAEWETLSLELES